MINLRATRIDQTFSLEDGETQNFLVVQLPNGAEVKAPINDDQTDQIIKASMNGSEVGNEMSGALTDPDYISVVKTGPGVPIVGLQSPTSSQQDMQQVGVQSDEQDSANAQAMYDQLSGREESSEGELINWGALPNETLTVTMKAAFKMLGAQPQLTFEDIQQLANNVAENFGPEEWGKVQEQIAIKPPAQQQARPPIAQVAWADGAPMVSGSVPSRTMPANEKGYPIVDGEVDPGEVVSGGDTDEDGVGQL